MKNKNLSPQLIKLLRKTRSFILKYPDRFDQGNDSGLVRNRGCTVKACTSPQCILGWMRLLYRGKKQVEQLFPQNDTEVVSDRLYYANYWPAKFKLESEGYRNDYWSGITAKTAAKRITHFIKTDGRE